MRENDRLFSAVLICEPKECLQIQWSLCLKRNFIDEVRLLTAMKQYLRQIKRHFPQFDSSSFQLGQVLHPWWKVKRARSMWKQSSNARVCWTKRFSRQLSGLVSQLTDVLDSLLPSRDLHCPTVDWSNLRRITSETVWYAASADTLIVRACLHTCSGFRARLVNPSQDFKSSFTCTFTHPFTPYPYNLQCN